MVPSRLPRHIEELVSVSMVNAAQKFPVNFDSVIDYRFENKVILTYSPADLFLRISVFVLQITYYSHRFSGLDFHLRELEARVHGLWLYLAE